MTLYSIIGMICKKCKEVYKTTIHEDNWYFCPFCKYRQFNDVVSSFNTK